MSLFRRLGKIISSHVEDLIDQKRHSESQASYQPMDEEAPKSYDNRSKFSYSNRELEYYSNLEVQPGTSVEEIRRSYKKLMRQYHPDMHVQDEDKKHIAIEITKKLNEAMDYFEKKGS